MPLDVPQICWYCNKLPTEGNSGRCLGCKEEIFGSPADRLEWTLGYVFGPGGYTLVSHTDSDSTDDPVTGED